MDKEAFPEIVPGGSLILAWQIKDKHVLVIGGGEVAAGRIYHLLNADAKVTVICPPDGLNKEVSYRIKKGQVKHIPRKFDRLLDLPSTESGKLHAGSSISDSNNESLNNSISMVLVAIDDPVVSSEIYKICKQLRIPVNIADVPPECDFYFGSMYRDGPLQIMISTNGRSPRMAHTIKNAISNAIPAGTGEAINSTGEIRQMLREKFPDSKHSKNRMKWIKELTDTYSSKEILSLNKKDREVLIEDYFPKGTVPSFEDLKSLSLENLSLE